MALGWSTTFVKSEISEKLLDEFCLDFIEILMVPRDEAY